jgi:acetoin utilization deacetylase AcuC-like enzyme
MCVSQDKYTPICPRTGETLSRDLGVIRTAVGDLLAALATSAPPTKAFAMTTLPGHHSSSVSFGGYCYVNFAAVAARMLRTKLDRVAVVGVDTV